MKENDSSEEKVIKNRRGKNAVTYVPRLCLYCSSFCFTGKKLKCDRDFWEIDLDLTLILIKGKKMRSYYRKGRTTTKDFANIFEYASICPSYIRSATPKLRFDEIKTKKKSGEKNE